VTALPKPRLSQAPEIATDYVHPLSFLAIWASRQLSTGAPCQLAKTRRVSGFSTSLSHVVNAATQGVDRRHHTLRAAQFGERVDDLR
jgi:hypothetical protein